MGVIGALSAGFAIYGLVTDHLGMTLIGLPTSAYFAVLSWLSSPKHQRSSDPEAAPGPLDRFFDRLGIEWLSGPKAPQDDASPASDTRPSGPDR